MLITYTRLTGPMVFLGHGTYSETARMIDNAHDVDPTANYWIVPTGSHAISFPLSVYIHHANQTLVRQWKL